MSPYRPLLFQSHPAFAQLGITLRERLSAFTDWPDVAEYNALRSERPESAVQAPIFVEQDLDRVKLAGGYEAFIAGEKQVPTRKESWHDLFNALIWLLYPRLKWALNRIQISERSSAAVDPRNGRSPVQSRGAQFDEGGIILLVSDDSLLDPIRRLDWTAFFLTGRSHFESKVRCLVFGHALYESLLTPFVGITAKALPVLWPAEKLAGFDVAQQEELDQLLEHQLYDKLRDNDFLPLPILGVPGWHETQTPEFYANEKYFRTQRSGATLGRTP